jgi:hypothetical protein
VFKEFDISIQITVKTFFAFIYLFLNNFNYPSMRGMSNMGKVFVCFLVFLALQLTLLVFSQPGSGL